MLDWSLLLLLLLLSPSFRSFIRMRFWGEKIRVDLVAQNWSTTITYIIYVESSFWVLSLKNGKTSLIFLQINHSDMLMKTWIKFFFNSDSMFCELWHTPCRQCLCPVAHEKKIPNYKFLMIFITFVATLIM